MRSQAKELQRRISLLKNALPCAYGFTAEDLVAAALGLGVPGAHQLHDRTILLFHGNEQ